MKLKKSLIVCGVARDCEEYLGTILLGIENLKKNFDKIKIIIVENDSKDRTKEILMNCSLNNSNYKIINLDGLSSINERTFRLEIARNAYITYLKDDPDLQNYDFLMVIDLDDINFNFKNFNLLFNSIAFLDSDDSIAGIFPNQLPNYYDLWALRHQTICPDDIFLDIARKVFSSKKYDQEIFNTSLLKKIFPLNIDINTRPIEVESAFGGIGFYKMKYIIENPSNYVGKINEKFIDNNMKQLSFVGQTCEHVSFNQGIRSIGGKLFILPDFINNFNCNRKPNPLFFSSIYNDLQGNPVFKFN